MSTLKEELEKLKDKPWFPTEIKQGDDGAIRFETTKEKEKEK
jgi:hypothetical protein